MYYEKHVFVCENVRESGRECCAHKGSVELRALLKERAKAALPGRRLRINGAGCLDRCEEGPTVVCYPEGSWFRLRNAADVDRFIEHYLVRGETTGIEDLCLPGTHPVERQKAREQSQQQQQQ